MAGGRPTKYKREYCQALLDYFRRPGREVHYEETYFPNGVLKTRKPIPDGPIDLPTFQGFADSINVDMAQLQRWQDKHSEFRIAYTRAKQIQEAIWLQESLSGRYNAQFAKFFGVNCLGYKDKIEQDITNTNFELRFDNMSAEEADEISG